MARKPRNHAAEYAARKARARASGYKSVREARRTRKVLALPSRRTLLPPKATLPKRLFVKDASGRKRIGRMRREAKQWSNKHSRINRTKYTPSLTDDQVERYHRAFVQTPLTYDWNDERKELMHDYFVPDFETEEEYQAYMLSD